jgi:hypothetical protein
MAIINRNQELPRDRVRLYEKAAELLLQQWDTERYLQDFPGLSAEIDLRAKSAILRKVALHMQTADGKAANLIEGERLVGLIEEYLHDELRFDQARAAANALVKQLRERNFILCFLGGNSYAFVHRTFLEYFCAAEYVHQFEKKRSLSLDDLLALYDAHCREDDWQEVLRLICGQVDEQFAGKIIERLIKLVVSEKRDREKPLRVLVKKLLLAVWCLSDVKNITKVEDEIGGKLLIHVIDHFFLSTNCNPHFLNNVGKLLLNAAQNIGTRWPGKSNFHFTGQFPKHSLSDQDFLYDEGLSFFWDWPFFLSSIFRQQSWIKKICLCDNALIRYGSVQALVEYWPDDNTRQFLMDRVRQDNDQLVRDTLIEEIAAHWQDEETMKMLRDLAPIEGAAASLYGKEHSHFGEIIFGEYLKKSWCGTAYLDPKQPIPAKHIQKTAKAVGIPLDKIDEAVRSLSEHMGWDITKGSLAKKL